jgi:hypothetical protein
LTATLVEPSAVPAQADIQAFLCEIKGVAGAHHDDVAFGVDPCHVLHGPDTCPGHLSKHVLE